MIDVTNAEVPETSNLAILVKLTNFYDGFVGNILFVFLGVGAVVSICEVRTKWWSRHRRRMLAIVAWVVNFLVLIGLTLIGTIALALVPIVDDAVR